ncbi:HEAT repeat family protein [Cryptosporidium serpentis]
MLSTSIGKSSLSVERQNFDRLTLKSSENYSPLERVIKYSNSKVVLQRLVVIREFIDICHSIGYNKATATLLQITNRLIQDTEESVKTGILNILGDLAGFLIQSDPDEGYELVVNNLVPLVKNVLIDDDSILGYGVKEAACEAGIILCSHLRHIDRVQSILSICLNLANDIDHEDSRCLSAWMLNGIAEYLGKDICKQYIIPQIKCLADDPSFHVRKFTAMNLCEIVRITEEFDNIFVIFNKLINDNNNSVRLYACKSLLGFFSYFKIEDLGETIKTILSSLLIDTDPCIRLECFKQLGPLIILFPSPDCVPKDLIDIFINMDKLDSEYAEKLIDPSKIVNLECDTEFNERICNLTEYSNETEILGFNLKNFTEQKMKNPSNSMLNPRYSFHYDSTSLFREKKGNTDDLITLLPLGNNMSFTFKKLDGDNPAFFCSYSFASLFSFMKSTYWPDFSNLLSRIISHPSSSVRFPVAASISLILATSLSCGIENHTCTVTSNLPQYDLSIKNNVMDSNQSNSSIYLGQSSALNLPTKENVGLIGLTPQNNMFYSNITRSPAKNIIAGNQFKLPCIQGCKYKYERLPLLLDLVSKLLEDNDTYIKRAMYGCLSDIVRCLPFEYNLELIIKKLPNMLNKCRNDWRCRNILSIQIRKICIELFVKNKESIKDSKLPKGDITDNLLLGKYTREYISPVAFSLLLDPVSTVRMTAINCISSLLRLSSPFIWFFFQNGGTIQELPVQIKPKSSNWNSKNINSNTNISNENISIRKTENLTSVKSFSKVPLIESTSNILSESKNYKSLNSDNSNNIISCNINSPDDLRTKKLHNLLIMEEKLENYDLKSELSLIWCILKSFAISPKYYHRQEYVRMCDRFIRDVPRGLFNTYFLTPLVLLTSDPVRNVRSILLRIIGPHIKETGRLAQCGNLVTACKLLNTTENDIEAKKYLANLNFLPKSALKRFETLSWKDITSIAECETTDSNTSSIYNTLSDKNTLKDWNEQTLIKCFNQYWDDVISSQWCLDNVPGSELISAPPKFLEQIRKPYYSFERCFDLTLEHEMMLLEVRPNFSSTNSFSCAPVIGYDTNVLDYEPYSGSHNNKCSIIPHRIGLSRRFLNNDQFYNQALNVLYRPGIPRSAAKFICPIGAEYNDNKIIESEEETIIETKKPEPNTAEQTRDICDQKLHAASRKIFMIDIARAATEDIFS